MAPNIDSLRSGQGEGLETKNYSVGAGMGRIGAGVSL
jgi:hypothetical protein